MMPRSRTIVDWCFKMPKIPFDQLFDLEKDPLPHGGATDLFGRVVWALTEEEEEAMVRKIQEAFGG
jgi:hypothetical protein